MNNQFQSLENAESYVLGKIKANPNSRLSALFRQLRSQNRFSLIGDYPILATVVSIVLERGIKPTRSSINHAFNQSEELMSLSRKEKSSLLDKLIGTSLEQ